MPADERDEDSACLRAAVAHFGVVTGEDRHELLVTHNFVIGWFVRHVLDAPAWRWIGLDQANCGLTILYVDGKIVGVVEAKREGEPLSSAVEQNDRYAAGVRKEHSLAVWRRDEPFAFRYATTGTETRFVNRLDPDARSRQVFSFHRPETISEWIH